MQRCRVSGSDQGRRCSIFGSGQYTEVRVCSHYIKTANVQGWYQSMRVLKIETWSAQGEYHCGKCQRFTGGQYRELFSADVEMKMFHKWN